MVEYIHDANLPAISAARGPQSEVLAFATQMLDIESLEDEYNEDGEEKRDSSSAQRGLVRCKSLKEQEHYAYLI